MIASDTNKTREMVHVVHIYFIDSDRVLEVNVYLLDTHSQNIWTSQDIYAHTHRKSYFADAAFAD